MRWVAVLVALVAALVAGGERPGGAAAANVSARGEMIREEMPRSRNALRRGRSLGGGARAAGAADAARPAPVWDGTGWLPGYENQRVADGPVLSMIHAATRRYWDGLGRTLPATSTVYLVDKPEAEFASAAGVDKGYKDNRILLDAEKASHLLRRARNAKRARVQREYVLQLYGTLAHEEGHLRGLEHQGTGSGPMTIAAAPPTDWRVLMRELRSSGVIRTPARRRATARTPR